MPQISDEQFAQARGVDLLSWLLKHEPQSVRRCGVNEYCLTEHDSLKISNGAWFWFSKGFGGYNCLDFLVKVRGVDFVTAVQSLTDGTPPSYSPEKALSLKSPAPKPLKPFSLPTANINNDHVYAYLRGRGIGKDIIDSCVKAGILYESKAHHCVFVGMDGNVPRFAFERGTTDNYKKDVAGSSKRFNFCLPPETPDGIRNLAVFESAIDCLAHFEIHRIGKTGWDGYRLSLGGIGSVSLMGFLERHPDTASVHICLDADQAGQNAARRITSELLINKQFSNMKITISPPALDKDYADCLQVINKNITNETKAYRQQQAVSLI